MLGNLVPSILVAKQGSAYWFKTCSNYLEVFLKSLVNDYFIISNISFDNPTLLDLFHDAQAAKHEFYLLR